jgi:hypothetical protein
MRRSSIHLRCRFQTSVVIQFSVMISFSTEIQFSRTIYGSAVTLRFLQFHASDMILFFLSISCIGRELIDAVDYIHRLSLSIHWWFQGLQWLSFPRWFVNQQWHSVFDNSMRQPRLYFFYRWCLGCQFIDAVDYIRRVSLIIHWRFQGLQLLCFRRRFMDQLWHSVFDNSMCQSWLYFCYRLDASIMNSLTLSIPYASCHSVFIYDYHVEQGLCFRWRFMDW